MKVSALIGVGRGFPRGSSKIVTRLSGVGFVFLWGTGSVRNSKNDFRKQSRWFIASWRGPFACERETKGSWKEGNRLLSSLYRNTSVW